MAGINIHCPRCQSVHVYRHDHSPEDGGILSEAPEMKSVFIGKHQAEFCVKVMCRLLRVARSG